MGYTTLFEGAIHVDPPLSEEEREYLLSFSKSRRWSRAGGPYATEDPPGSAAADQGGVAEGQPSLWCHWVPSADGQFIHWDGCDKFYDAHEWMAYVIHHFFAPDPWAKLSSEGFERFGGHRFNGEILAIGERAASDVWLLRVVENSVSVAPACWPSELIQSWGRGFYVDPREALGHSHRLAYAAEETPVPDFARELGPAPWSGRERARIDSVARPGRPGDGPKAL